MKGEGVERGGGGLERKGLEGRGGGWRVFYRGGLKVGFDYHEKIKLQHCGNGTKKMRCGYWVSIKMKCLVVK